jgi:hypothetical protein
MSAMTTLAPRFRKCRASLDTERLVRTMVLGETQFIMFAQTVGYARA